MRSRGNFSADRLFVVVDRSEVEAIDVSRTTVTLSRVLINRKTFNNIGGA